jgi:hypothetical protein
MRPDNFRFVAVGGLADVIDQVPQWHNGVRVRVPDDAAAIPLRSIEDLEWDRLIRGVPEIHRGTGSHCECFRCRPNRRYK